MEGEMKRIVAMTVLVLSITPAAASEHMRITRCPNSWDYRQCAVITIKDDITLGDGDEFVERVQDINAAYVVFKNNYGGNPFGAIKIGKAIRQKGFRAYADGVCASACATAWLGDPRPQFMQNSVVIFHAASLIGDPSHTDATANVALGMYLHEMGIPLSDVLALGGHDPEDYGVIKSNWDAYMCHGQIEANDCQKVGHFYERGPGPLYLDRR
jgi:hypothetical protein